MKASKLLKELFKDMMAEAVASQAALKDANDKKSSLLTRLAIANGTIENLQKPIDTRELAALRTLHDAVADYEAVCRDYEGKGFSEHPAGQRVIDALSAVRLIGLSEDRREFQ